MIVIWCSSASSASRRSRRSKAEDENLTKEQGKAIYCGRCSAAGHGTRAQGSGRDAHPRRLRRQHGLRGPERRRQSDAAGLRAGRCCFGDGHARQGEGEIVGTGVETSMDVEFTVDLIKKKTIGWPRIENETYVMVLGSERPLLQAFQHATTEMLRLARDRLRLTRAWRVNLDGASHRVRDCQRRRSAFHGRRKDPQVAAAALTNENGIHSPLCERLGSADEDGGLRTFARFSGNGSSRTSDRRREDSTLPPVLAIARST